ncbi:hypothetical protein [Helicobacter canadensis]|uniref:Chemotaxis phosphatase CheX-like domain-containing protein n=1 Tax=Helicobacter canadensis MIT 98-5491 TaxID=537970 RepID=C5ZVH5_9HELI|nr:hypothetical protein [Helicobacter canadensis]EES89099.1 conserved hypothetical protein [Helicobacter canadensis MIT 98-5491]EFR47876.1 hypothetical protein HCMG_00049 [Helicobacter canadensis MIT 98-5491]STO99130.1 Uncharacterised protein [Helicobacter canadensis]
MLDKIIKNAFKQAIEDTLGKTPQVLDEKILEGFLSGIDIVYNDGDKNTITFISTREFLEKFGNGLLGEEDFDELALKDLSQELANLTIGLAKVLAVTEGVRFNISTPKVYGFGEFKDSSSKSLNFALEGARCSLFIHI